MDQNDPTAWQEHFLGSCASAISANVLFGPENPFGRSERPMDPEYPRNISAIMNMPSQPPNDMLVERILTTRNLIDCMDSIRGLRLIGPVSAERETATLDWWNSP
jgi:hypothetical protein